MQGLVAEGCIVHRVRSLHQNSPMHDAPPVYPSSPSAATRVRLQPSREGPDARSSSAARADQAAPPREACLLRLREEGARLRHAVAAALVRVRSPLGAAGLLRVLDAAGGLPGPRGGPREGGLGNG